MNLDKMNLTLEEKLKIFEILKKYATEKQKKEMSYGIDPELISIEDKAAIVKIIVSALKSTKSNTIKNLYDKANKFCLAYKAVTMNDD